MAETLLNIIPTNPVQSLVEGDMLQIIVFCVFLGLGIAMLGKNGRLTEAV